MIQRSVSPSKFESQGTGSPTKLNLPNRKLRNQPSNRIHDIEFAAEISTSLIAQVRSLQSILAEKEEEVRDLKVDKSQLEIEAEGFQQRLKTLDESEHRYKDENWNLETQIRELLSVQKEAADREKKLGQNLTIVQAEKNAALRELDEVKLAHAKLTEEQVAAAKHHDVELGAAKRSIAMADNERAMMQRKIEDLTNQNQELAKAFSMQRGRTLERDGPSKMSDEDFDTATDNMTPDHSPPPSPVKGTPRHSMLESETLRTSFQHLQRQLQLMRTNLHREKTEKLELRRILQESRDELERLRLKGEMTVPPPSKRIKKMDMKEFKKPKAAQLGAHRTPRHEILMDDPDWEDQVDSPSRSTARISPASRVLHRSGDVPASGSSPMMPTSETEVFVTANETSDAFETANERDGTETDDFKTGVEQLSGEDDTETESLNNGTLNTRRPSTVTITGLGHTRNRDSFDSTASNSTGEDELAMQMRTPPIFPPPQRIRFKMSRGTLSRRSRQPSEEPQLASSPAASFGGSIGGTPQQSLFAELGELDGSDDDSLINTPSRRSVRSMTPASAIRLHMASPMPPLPPIPKAIMVDAMAQTDPILQLASSYTPSADSDIGTERAIGDSPLSSANTAETHRPISLAPSIDVSKRFIGEIADSEGLQSVSSGYSDSGVQYDPEIELSPLPTLVLSSVEAYLDFEPVEAAVNNAVTLSFSTIKSENVCPIIQQIQLPQLSISAVQAESVEPQHIEPPTPSLNFSRIATEEVEPVSEPLPVPPTFSLSGVIMESVEPITEPQPKPVNLSISCTIAEEVKPIIASEPSKPEPPTLSISHTIAEEVEPIVLVEPSKPEPLVLSFSRTVTEEVEPIAALEPPKPDAPILSISPIASEAVEPVASPMPSLSVSGITSEVLEPVAIPIPSLSVSGIISEVVEPVASPLPVLSISSIASEVVKPATSPVPFLSISSIVSETLEPVIAKPPSLQLSGIISREIEPIKPEALRLAVSHVISEAIEPVVPKQPCLAVSAMTSTSIAPVEQPTIVQSQPVLSAIEAVSVSPISSPIRRPCTPPLILSSVATVSATSPVTPKSPERSVIIIAHDDEIPVVDDLNNPTSIVESTTHENGTLHHSQASTKIDNFPFQCPQETLGSLASPSLNNVVSAGVEVSDHSVQTNLTSEEIDRLLFTHAILPLTPEKKHLSSGITAFGLGRTPSTLHRRLSEESLSSVIRRRSKTGEVEAVLYENLQRPDSSTSSQAAAAAIAEIPPLPPNHRQAIEAARAESSHSVNSSSNMGPPLFPASALRNPVNSNARPLTPSSPPFKARTPARRTREIPAPHIAGFGPSHGIARVGSPNRLTDRSRQSSVSSFASEIESRFQLQDGLSPHGFAPGTDSRMIQAITQTMIGEYLWKYTRKTASANMSQTRHRRYFWVHPYTRTLYWSDRDPAAQSNRSEGRTKSVQIEAVRVVTDDNPYPPGLHRKSLIVISPGRTIKFTCQTGQRHETWFNALSYLLLRSADASSATEQLPDSITQEDVDEFNPSYIKRHNNGNRPRAPPSLSSYNSRPSGRTSPAIEISTHVPTLTPTQSSKTMQRPSIGTLRGRISGYWRSGNFTTLRSRSAVTQTPSIYETSEVHDSAEDLRQMIEQQDREADRLENVRACCDGKHDVGTLSHTKRGGRPSPHPHSHSHPGPSITTASTPISTLRSRA